MRRGQAQYSQKAELAVELLRVENGLASELIAVLLFLP